MTSPATSGRHLSKFKKLPKSPPTTTLGRISPERFKLGFQHCTHVSGTIGLIYMPVKAWFTVSDRLQLNTAQKVRRRGPTGNESNNSAPVFNMESPNFTRTSILAYARAASDMTSLATSGRQLSQFKIR